MGRLIGTQGLLSDKNDKYRRWERGAVAPPLDLPPGLGVGGEWGVGVVENGEDIGTDLLSDPLQFKPTIFRG